MIYVEVKQGLNQLLPMYTVSDDQGGVLARHRSLSAALSAARWRATERHDLITLVPSGVRGDITLETTTGKPELVEPDQLPS